MNKKLQIILFFAVLYIYTFYRFIGDEILPFMIELYPFILFFTQSIVIILGLSKLTIAKQGFIKTLFFLFLATTTVTFFINYPENSLVSHLNGLRGYVSIFALYLFFNWIYKSKIRLLFINKFNKFLNVFLVIQIPISIFQFLKYGAGDKVGGSLSEGFSGVLTLLLFVIVFYKIFYNTRRLGKSFFREKDYLKYFPFLLPVFINETKISFFLFPLMVLLLMRFEAKYIYRNFMMGIGFLGILFVFNNVYHDVSQEGERQSIETIYTFDFVNSYLFSDSDDIVEDQDISRLERFYLYNDLLSESILNTLFGKGFGLFKGSSFLGESEFVLKNKELFSGSKVSLAMIFIQGGFISMGVILLLLVYMINQSLKNIKSVCSRRLLIFNIFIIILTLIYTSVLTSFFFMSFIINIFFICYEKKTHNNLHYAVRLSR